MRGKLEHIAVCRPAKNTRVPSGALHQYHTGTLGADPFITSVTQVIVTVCLYTKWVPEESPSMDPTRGMGMTRVAIGKWEGGITLDAHDR